MDEIEPMLDIIANYAVIATPIVIGVGFYFAYRQWQAARNARIAQVIVSLMSQWDSPKMAESRRKVNESGPNLESDYKKADKANAIEAYSSFTEVSNFFDGLGALVAEGYLDVAIAFDVWGKAEKTYYGLYEPMLKNKNYEEYVLCFQKLHDLFVKEEARRSKVKRRRAS